MHRPSIYALALALSVSLHAEAQKEASPLATGFSTRAALMEHCADYLGAADQLTRYLDIQERFTSDAAEQSDEARLRLMRALLMQGNIRELTSTYDDFMSVSAASYLAPQAEAVMADALFFSGDFEEALRIYSRLPLNTFPSPVLAGTKYRMAVSMIRRGLFSEAALEFAYLKQEEGYNGISRFYLAYISYIKEDYRRALYDFGQLPADIASEMGADFYIAQIYFSGRMYDRVLAMEPQLLAAAARIDSEERHAQAEALRLLGESAHALGDTPRALSRLRRHASMHPDGGELSARYILGAAEYADKNYSKAAEWMLPVSREDNAQAQSALLYLGQCSAKMGDYSAAAIYFDRAARMDQDSQVAETALYNYAAATAHGGNVPFGSATDLLEEFARRYPASPYAPAVEEYLATGYYREHRYADALERIGHIARPSAEVLRLKQRAEYDLGADLLASGRASMARRYLQSAADSRADASVSSQACLWLSDCLYKLKDYKEALNAYNRFLASASPADAQRPLALYNRAYTLFQTGDYTGARSGFEQALRANLSAGLSADATLRIADCLNFTGNVTQALDTYRRAAAMPGATGTDYAVFQTANMLGVLGKNAEKAKALEKLLKERPESSWCSSALAELAEAQQAMGDFNAARATIERLRLDYPDSEQLRMASLSMADALADKGKTTEAIEAYERLVRQWPTSEQARVAAENLQTICTEQGELQRYLSFIKSVPNAPQPDAARVARLAYQAAMNAFERNPKDVSPLESFVADYPNSPDVPDALLEIADFYMTQGAQEKALAAASKILTEYPHSKGVAPALILKGGLLASRGDRNGASSAYRTLLDTFGSAYARQAYMGLMQNASEPAAIVNYADRLLALPDVPAADRRRAELCRAEALMNAGRLNEALAAFTPLAADMRTATGGHAAVMMARIYLHQNQPAKAEEIMSRFTADGCDDMRTLAEGYIALADALNAQNRRTLAREYLEALLENYPQADEDIRTNINQRLNKWK